MFTKRGEKNAQVFSMHKQKVPIMRERLENFVENKENVHVKNRQIKRQSLISTQFQQQSK